MVVFRYYYFDLRKFLKEEKKFIILVREIQLLALLGSVFNGLMVCRKFGLPHGNLSQTTIFKKSKLDWEISPPLYSKVNLYKRRTQKSKVFASFSNPDQIIDYLMAPEIHDFINELHKCRL